MALPLSSFSFFFFFGGGGGGGGGDYILGFEGAPYLIKSPYNYSNGSKRPMNPTKINFKEMKFS